MGACGFVGGFCIDVARYLLEALSRALSRALSEGRREVANGLQSREPERLSTHVAFQREGSAQYSTPGDGIDKARDKDGAEKLPFHHETLDVYKVAIEVATAFCASEAVSCLSNQAFRRLDELLTSMVLNIAEGNGRFSDADQARFLGTSHESAIKLAARLDLCVTQNLLPRDEVVGWKALLQRVSVMASSMIAGIQR